MLAAADPHSLRYAAPHGVLALRPTWHPVQVKGLREENLKLKEDNMSLREDNFKLRQENMNLQNSGLPGGEMPRSLRSSRAASRVDSYE